MTDDVIPHLLGELVGFLGGPFNDFISREANVANVSRFISGTIAGKGIDLSYLYPGAGGPIVLHFRWTAINDEIETFQFYADWAQFPFQPSFKIVVDSWSDVVGVLDEVIDVLRNLCGRRQQIQNDDTRDRISKAFESITDRRAVGTSE